MKRKYWCEIIPTLELKEFITSAEDSSLMATKQQQYTSNSTSIKDELEGFYWKLNSSYMLLILLCMNIMDLIIHSAPLGSIHKGNDSVHHMQRFKQLKAQIFSQRSNLISFGIEPL